MSKKLIDWDMLMEIVGLHCEKCEFCDHLSTCNTFPGFKIEPDECPIWSSLEDAGLKDAPPEPEGDDPPEIF